MDKFVTALLKDISETQFLPKYKILKSHLLWESSLLLS